MQWVTTVSVTFARVCEDGRDDSMRMKQFHSPTMGRLGVAFLIRTDAGMEYRQNMLQPLAQMGFVGLWQMMNGTGLELVDSVVLLIYWRAEVRLLADTFRIAD